MNTAQIYAVVGIAVGITSIMAVLVKAIYSAARLRDTVIMLTESMEKMTDKMEKMEERMWNAVQDPPRRGRLPGNQFRNG